MSIIHAQSAAIAAAERIFIQVQDATIADFDNAPGTAGAAIVFNTDRSVDYLRTVLADTIGAYDWLRPMGISPDAYEIRAQSVSGVVPTGPALNTWHSLSVARSWSISRSIVGVTSSVIDVSIREFPGPALDTGRITLDAEVS